MLRSSANRALQELLRRQARCRGTGIRSVDLAAALSIITQTGLRTISQLQRPTISSWPGRGNRERASAMPSAKLPRTR
jgi:hypothetical protein